MWDHPPSKKKRGLQKKKYLKKREGDFQEENGGCRIDGRERAE